MKNQECKIGQTVMIQRPQESFTGKVKESRIGWIRIAGHGSIIGTWFDEWFSTNAPKSIIYAI